MTAVSRLSQRTRGECRGVGGGGGERAGRGTLNVLRVCGVHTAISKQTRAGEAKIKFSACQRSVH